MGLMLLGLWPVRSGQSHPLLKFFNIYLIISIVILIHIKIVVMKFATNQNNAKILFHWVIIKLTHPFDLIHYDLWGKYHTATYNDSHYFLTIVDDYSRGSWACLMNNKTEMLQHLMNFYNLIKKKFNKHITRIQSENGTKLMNFKI